MLVLVWAVLEIVEGYVDVYFWEIRVLFVVLFFFIL